MNNDKQLATVTPGDQYKKLSLDEIKHIAGTMIAAKMFPNLESVNTAFVKILAGQEMGIPPFQAMNGIDIIKGKASLSANLMATKVQESGRYRYRVQALDDTICVIDFQARENDKWKSIGQSSFTVEDAQRAGTQNMDKFPRNMLFARALSNGTKWYTPDVFGGASVYVEGELDPTDEEIKVEQDARSDRVAGAALAGQSAKAKETAKAKKAEPEPNNDSQPVTTDPKPIQESADSDVQAEPVVEEPIKEAETAPSDADEPATAQQRRRVFAMLGEMGFTDAEKKLVYTGMTDKQSFTELSKASAAHLIDELEKADVDGLRLMFITAAGA